LDSHALKAVQLFEQIGFEEAVEPGDLVAIKTHMGELYNVGYLRPIIVRAIVDKVRELGGRPFVCDTTTMPYHPWISRTLAVDHLDTANRHGFNQGSMGCPVLMADGWLGTDDVVVDLQGRGCLLHKQFVARAVAEANVLVSLAHFKGHPAGGYGGALKNVGVGCASKRGKMNLHGGLAGDKPLFNEGKCPGRECEWWEECGKCCPEGAIEVLDSGVRVDFDRCVYCFACGNLCTQVAKVGALQRFDAIDSLGRRIADSALAVALTKKPGKALYLNYALDITPICDCYGWADTPFVNDLGVFASLDPVAVDQACLDKLNEAVGLRGSAAEDFDAMEPGSRKLELIKGKQIDWQVVGGVENGLGSREYDLREIELDKSKPYWRKVYPRIPAEDLKPMYERQHPLEGVDRESFGRPTPTSAAP
jgi:uncharacterized Fe-S center protein